MERAPCRAVVLSLLLLLTAASAAAQPPALASGSLERMIQRGNASLLAGDSISAISFLRDGVARAPRDARGYAALGQAYLQLNEPNSALEVFEAGARNTRGSLELSLGLAKSYQLLGKSERGMQVLRQLASSGESSPALQLALAEQAEALGAFVEALAARRALLWLLQAQSEVDDATLHEARTRVAALELVLGKADRLSSAHCEEQTRSPVLQVLRGCPSAANDARNSLP